MFDQEIEKKIESNEKKIAIMKMKLERYEKTFNQMFEETNLSPEELTSYLSTSDNFDPHIWNHLEEIRLQLDNKLNKELENIRNPFKTSQSYAERKEIQRHWLFVK